MDAVTLTFPGHFFQTALSIQSTHFWYQPNRHYVIVDDLEKGPWESYYQDACEFYGPELIFIPTSSIPKMENTLSGWWRQQLIKLTIDKLIPGDEWLVIDGDVIFESFCPFKDIVPTVVREVDPDITIENFTRNYVRGVLGVERAKIYHDGQPCMTNPVPYRLLSRSLLEQLRLHVEKRFDNDFVDLHIRWFHDQTIVGMHQDQDKWSMSEWELIEVFREEILKEHLPRNDIGAGYPINVDVSRLDLSKPIYRHGYIRDSQITMDWFVEQGLTVNSQTWQQSRQWLEAREPWRA